MLVNRDKLLCSLLSIREENAGVVFVVCNAEIKICTQYTIANYYAASETIEVVHNKTQAQQINNVAITLLNIVNTDNDKINFERFIKILKLLEADNININITIVNNIATMSISQLKLNAMFSIEFETEEIPENITYTRKPTLPLFNYTEDTYKILSKCKNSLGNDEYKPKLMCYYVENNTIYATNGISIISAKFECSCSNVITICSELCNPKFIGCKVFQIDNTLHIVNDSSIYVLYNEQAEVNINFFSQVKNMIISNKSNNFNEIDIQAIRIIATIASYERNNSLLLRLSSKGTFEFYESESWLGLSGEVSSKYSRTDDDKELQYCINAKLLLSYIDLLNFCNDEIAVFEVVTSLSNTDNLIIITKNLGFTLLFTASLKVDNLLEQQELYKNREANFPKSGWSSWREYQDNNYKTVKEVDFTKKYEELKDKYKQAINSLIPANVEEIAKVQQANSKLSEIKNLLVINQKKAISEFDLSEAGQKLILLLQQLKTLNKLEESEERKLLSQDLQINIDLLKKERKHYINKVLADLTTQAKQLQSIVNKNPKLLSVNIEQLANSNSHILAEKERVESEYQDFLKNPSKYIDIPLKKPKEEKQKDLA